MTTAHFPLTSHQPGEPIAYGPRGVIHTAQFMAQVQAVARSLPAAQYVVNICANRYHFLLGFAAAVVAGKTTLMPSTVTEQVLQQLAHSYPQDLALLSDAASDVPAHSLPSVDLSA